MAWKRKEHSFLHENRLTMFLSPLYSIYSMYLESGIMEARKIQQVGSSTLAVSLPSKWVKEVGLKRGDLVLLAPAKGSSLRLMLSAPSESKAGDKVYTVNLDLCDGRRMLERVIVGTYVLGRDTVRIISSKRILGEQVDEVRRTARKLLGVGLIEETPNSIVLQCSIQPEKFPMNTVLRRLYAIVSTMYREVMQSLAELNPELAHDAIRREDEVDTMYWLTVRLILSAQEDEAVARKISPKEPLDIAGNRLIAKLLELIADYAETMAEDVIDIAKSRDDIEKPFINTLHQLGNMAADICDKAMNCIFTGDINLANNAIESKVVLEVEEEKLMKRLNAQIREESVWDALRSFAFGAKKMAEYGAEIAEIAINWVLVKPSRLCHLHENSNVT